MQASSTGYQSATSVTRRRTALREVTILFGTLTGLQVMTPSAMAQQPAQPSAVQPPAAVPAAPLDLQACRKIGPYVHCLVQPPGAAGLNIILTPEQFDSLTKAQPK
jgi:hypothetical protein